jgi:hypothetical protein
VGKLLNPTAQGLDMMKTDSRSERKRERLEISLPVRVRCRESVGSEWMELTRLIDVTPFGAGFTLTHLTEPGRLLDLTLPMPRQLRCYDHTEQQYHVWALVRHVQELPPSDNGPARFVVGVAFIGKRSPTSYEVDPSTRYDVAATTEETGLWSLIEKEPESIERRDSSESGRPKTRHGIPVEVVIEVFDERGAITGTETTVTENINQRGAAVFTTLDVDRGRFVRITSAQYKISVTAAVRARRIGTDGVARLHLEFIDKQWPLEGLD